MTRDFDYERKLYEIEDSYEINGYILAHLLYDLNACSIEQLATAFYLYRYPNISIKILELTNIQNDILIQLNDYEIFNLDTVLMPLISEKYNKRFKNGFKQLLAYSLIISEEDKITLNLSNLYSMKNLETSDSNLIVKVKLVSNIVKSYNISELNSLITKIVGDHI